ncbi:hypothetical protein KGF56_001536 [Candida oxycetoniae]|uniref:Hydroxyacyl-thioester dehydratase type 2, mitochondrial n=1 Tax=Candida oxycetoniae TaxID=497107 RepID=A0AAI9SYG3_9ASCO|nr:uncharacterized protein KGF56_001536 [Candida oxycetoniae]KAI3405518.2 hypothetical protein KGF56_001536 [Candida oxycetoniae]
MTAITKECINRWASTIKQKTFKSNDTYSIGSITHLWELLGDIFAGKSKSQNQKPKSILPNAWLSGAHFLFNNQSNLNIGSDGYDNYQAPVLNGNHQLYLRRLWARGSINISSVPELNSSLHCDEKVTSVRFIDENVLVNIERSFYSRILSPPLLVENRTLMYTNKLYFPAKTKPILLNEKNVLLVSPPIQLSSIDLLKYSMLTYNLHKIHIDTNYCHSIENLPTLIVHGPLQVTLLLYYFQLQYPKITPHLFSYRTYEPCFVNEELAISITENGDQFDLALCNPKDKRVKLKGQLHLLEKYQAPSHTW